MAAAGLTVWGFPGYTRSEPMPSAVAVLDGEGNTDPVRVYQTPGESWQYSGGGYTVLQQALADVADRPFPEIAHDRVLAPAGMTSSGYYQPLPDSLHDRAATAYRSNGDAVEGNWHVYPELAAAGLWTTPSDLARFAIALQNDYHGAGILLNQATVQEMLTPGLNEHGLGPGVSADTLLFGHGGANEGYRCNLSAFVDGRGGIAVMTNSDSGGTLAREIMLTVAREYGWPGFEPERIETVTLSSEAYQAFVGTYDFGDNGVATVAYEEGSLVATRPDGGQLVLLPTDSTTFVARTEPTRVRFEVVDGQAQRMVVNDRVEGIRQ